MAFFEAPSYYCIMATLVKKQRTVRRPRLKKWDKIFLCVMLGIPIVYFLVFWVYVNFDSILLAFRTTTGEWSTLNLEKAWKELTTGGGELFIALRNTLLIFMVNVVLIPLEVLIAYFFYRKIKGYRIFQVIFYLPSIISTVVICQSFIDVIANDGPLGTLLINMGVDLPKEGLLGTSVTAMPVVLFYMMWIGWGGNMLLLGGAMSRIPKEVLESARIDGVNTFQEIIYFVFPLLWSSISVFLLLAVTSLLITSGPILALTGGAYETSTIAYWIYAKLRGNAVSQSNYNEVAATGLLLTVLYMPIVLGIRKLLEKVPTVQF